MKKIICFCLLGVCVLLAGCAELISKETTQVEAIITEVDRDPMRIIGKVIMPADFDIYFEYDGIKGSWDINRKTYELYKDKIGDAIACNLITLTYDDGTIKRRLVSIEEKVK